MPMEPQKFTTIAHQDHRFCCPVSAAKAAELVEALELRASDRVIDVGCGKAEWLIRLVERYDVHAIGVDTNSQFLEEARRQAGARIRPGRLELHHLAMTDFAAGDGVYAASICIGSSHAFGDHRSALWGLANLTRPGGLILLGEGYWKQPPTSQYLAFLGAELSDFRTHAGNVLAGLENGLTPLYSCVSSDDEWDRYEGLYSRAVDRHLGNHPNDPDVDELRDRIGSWREAYLRWGRDTFGFGFYLFRKPVRAADGGAPEGRGR